jgi:hypothetical protein
VNEEMNISPKGQSSPLGTMFNPWGKLRVVKDWPLTFTKMCVCTHFVATNAASTALIQTNAIIFMPRETFSAAKKK